MMNNLDKWRFELKYYKKPDLKNVTFIAGWPGMGFVSTIAIDHLRGELNAELFAEIFSYKSELIYRDGVVIDSKIRHRFYHIPDVNLVLCIGEDQPKETTQIIELTEMILDFVESLGIKRIYTLAAYLTGEDSEPKVYGVVNKKELTNYLETYGVNMVSGLGAITGLNGFLIGAAKKRGLDGICLLGEITYAELPQPNSAKSILVLLSRMLNFNIKLDSLDKQTKEITDTLQKRFQESTFKETQSQFKAKQSKDSLNYIG